MGNFPGFCNRGAVMCLILRPLRVPIKAPVELQGLEVFRAQTTLMDFERGLGRALTQEEGLQESPEDCMLNSL